MSPLAEVVFERNPQMLDWPNKEIVVLVLEDPQAWQEDPEGMPVNSVTQPTYLPILLPIVGERHVREYFTRAVHFATTNGGNFQLVSHAAHNLSLAMRNREPLSDQAEIITALAYHIATLNQPD